MIASDEPIPFLIGIGNKKLKWNNLKFHAALKDGFMLTKTKF